jgi:predicted HTH transcriptional regulator
MYNTTPELLEEIAAGEDAYLEFKEVVFKGRAPRFAGEQTRATEAMARVLCSFANAEGGVLVFGVNDSQDVVGVDPDKASLLEQWVVNVSQNNCEPPVYVIPDWKRLPDASGATHRCLKVDVPKSPYVHRTSGDRWMTRVGSHKLDLRPDQLARLLERRQMGKPFEERAVRTADLSALDMNLFEDYVRRRFDPEEIGPGPGLESLLVNLKLAVHLDSGPVVPTVVGLLLFGRSPITDALPGAFVQCVLYRGRVADANAQLDSKRFEGPVPEQIIQATRFVERYIPVAAEKTHEGRLDHPAFSLRAVHEAIVNATVHRDYQLSGSNVRVVILDERIEISNPGGLHNTLRPENLFAGAQPYRRNQALAGFLRDYQSPISGRALMESRGEGFLMLVRETHALGGEVGLDAQPEAVKLVLKRPVNWGQRP